MINNNLKITIKQKYCNELISINSHLTQDQHYDLLDTGIRHYDTLDACRSHESPPFETRQPRVLGKKSARTRLTNWSIPPTPGTSMSTWVDGSPQVNTADGYARNGGGLKSCTGWRKEGAVRAVGERGMNGRRKKGG